MATADNLKDPFAGERGNARPVLRECFRRGLELSPGKQTPHLLDEAFNWHMRYLRTGTMQG